MKFLLAIIVLSSLVCLGSSQSFCDKYVNATGLTGRQIMTLVVNNTFFTIANPQNGIVQYFNGTQPPNTTNFFTDLAAAQALFELLVRFFGNNLGCSDGSIQNYNGRDMTVAHAGLGINYFAFSKFNTIVLNLTRDALSGLAEYNETDVLGVGTVLNSLKGSICTTADCNNFCNKYSVPYNLNNYALLSTVVGNVFTAISGSQLLLPFFNGSIPANSTNFFADSVAAGRLANHLITFFGQNGVLSCTDGSVGAYLGRDMRSAHALIPINNATFVTFNAALVDVLDTLGVSDADLNVVRAVLESTRGDICNQPDCGNPVTSSSSAAGSSSLSSAIVTNTQPVTTPVPDDDSSSCLVMAPLVALLGSLVFFF